MTGALSLAGCTRHNSEQGAVTPANLSFGELIDTAINDATNLGGSQAQLAILEDARTRGEITFEQARDAIRSTVECISDLGFNAAYHEQIDPEGLAVPGYVVQTEEGPGIDSDADEAFDASQQCEDSESLWVSQVYETQPATR